jgi:hypothetical protein
MGNWRWFLILSLGIGLWFIKPSVSQASGSFSVNQTFPTNGANSVPVNLLSETYHPTFGYANQSIAITISGLPMGCTVNQASFNQQTVHLTSPTDQQIYFLTTVSSNLDPTASWFAVGSPTVGFELLPNTTYTLHILSGVSGIGFSCGAQVYRLSQDVRIAFTTGADTVPPQILGPQVQTTSTTAVVHWETFQAATGQVAYGVVSPNQLTNAGSIGTLHRIPISNLQPGTTYTYEIRSRDPASNIATTSGQFTTVGLGDIVVKDITDMAATIEWTSNQPTDTIVEFGGSDSYGNRQGNGGQLTAHNWRMVGLQPSTTYHFRIVATNSNGSSHFGDNFFTTETSGAVTGTNDTRAGISTSHDNIKLFPQLVFRPIVLGASTAARVAGDTISVGRNLLTGGSTTQSGNQWLSWLLWLFPLLLLILIGGLWWHIKHAAKTSTVR